MLQQNAGPDRTETRQSTYDELCQGTWVLRLGGAERHLVRTLRWHRYHIEVNGQDFIVRLNGTETTHVRRDPAERLRGNPPSVDPYSGFIGLQTHTGSVAFANIAIRRL